MDSKGRSDPETPKKKAMSSEERPDASVELEPVGCALCGGSVSRPLFRTRDLRYETTPRVEFTLVECSSCGLRYLNPRPTEASLQLFYPEEYYTYRPDQAAPSEAGSFLRRLYPSRNRRQLHENVSMATRLLPPGGRFLEVGPGAGRFLQAMTARGFQGVGLERSPSMVRFIREILGLECFSPDAFDSAAHGEVHLVVLWNAFEHLGTPLEFMKWARSVLLPGGHLLLSIPNGSAFERSLFFRGQPCEDIPRHLYSYTPVTIRRMLETAGYDTERIIHVSRASTSQFQERLERAIFKGSRARLLRRLLYVAFLLPFVWVGDRLAGAAGRGHTMVVVARKPGRERSPVHDRIPGHVL